MEGVILPASPNKIIAYMSPIKLWFEDDRIFIEAEGKISSQSLKWYPILRKATTEQRERYRFTSDGIRWDEIDEDVSFESFSYDDPTGKSQLRVLFDEFPELNVSKIAAQIGTPQSVFASYLCGVKNPSQTRLKETEDVLHALGRELLRVKLV